MAPRVLVGRPYVVGERRCAIWNLHSNTIEAIIGSIIDDPVNSWFWDPKIIELDPIIELNPIIESIVEPNY